MHFCPFVCYQLSRDFRNKLHSEKLHAIYEFNDAHKRTPWPLGFRFDLPSTNFVHSLNDTNNKIEQFIFVF